MLEVQLQILESIDFQQRISALFLTHMFMDVVFIDDLGLNGDSKIIDLKEFESTNEIDDLVVTTENSTVYIQAKRSINCSESKSSEFIKGYKTVCFTIFNWN